MSLCECEHKAHEEQCTNPPVIKLNTDYGIFRICAFCYNLGHMQKPYTVEKGK